MLWFNIYSNGQSKYSRYSRQGLSLSLSLAFCLHVYVCVLERDFINSV